MNKVQLQKLEYSLQHLMRAIEEESLPNPIHFQDYMVLCKAIYDIREELLSQIEAIENYKE